LRREEQVATTAFMDRRRGKERRAARSSSMEEMKAVTRMRHYCNVASIY
jgi:hypothetical protein